MTTKTVDHPKSKSLPEFLPVIFANDEDDDTPGFVAAITNQAVQFDETVYRPGQDLSVVGRSLRFLSSVRLTCSCGCGATVEIESGEGGEMKELSRLMHGRIIRLTHCRLRTY